MNKGGGSHHITEQNGLVTSCCNLSS